MQTKQQIQQALANAQITPNQRRGQNFLVDLNLMRLLVDLACIQDSDIVLEVGCGTGSLTSALAEKAGKVIAVEIDPALAKIAEGELSEFPNVEIIVSDVLASKNTIDSRVITALESTAREFRGPILLVANLPYNVASAVMLNLVTGPLFADRMYVTVQKEVADRMTASPGSKSYGILSVLLGAAGDVKIERTLRPNVFWPRPQVGSAMVSFVRSYEKVPRIRDMQMLKDVVSLFMGHRRKMLKACVKLASGHLASIRNWPMIFRDCFIDPQRRPDQLAVDDYVAIANRCHE